jgi:hypothetical protein
MSKAAGKTSRSMVASGEVAIPVAATYRLEEIGAAIAHQARGGKVLLKVGSRCNVRGPGKLEQGELVTIFPLPEQSDWALAPNVVGFSLLSIRRGK